MGEGHESGSGRHRSAFLLLAMAMTAVFHLSPSGCGSGRSCAPRPGEIEAGSAIPAECVEDGSAQTELTEPGSLGGSSPDMDGEGWTVPAPTASDLDFLPGFYRTDLRYSGPVLVREGRLTQERLEAMLEFVGDGPIEHVLLGLPRSEEWLALPVESIPAEEADSHCDMDMGDTIGAEPVAFFESAGRKSVCPGFSPDLPFVEVFLGVGARGCGGSSLGGRGCFEQEFFCGFLDVPDCPTFRQHIQEFQDQMVARYMETVCYEDSGVRSGCQGYAWRRGYTDRRSANQLDLGGCCPEETRSHCPERAGEMCEQDPCQADQSQCENRVACLQNTWKTNPPPCLQGKLAECFKTGAASGAKLACHDKSDKQCGGDQGYTRGKNTVICTNNAGQHRWEPALLHELVHVCSAALSGIDSEALAEKCQNTCYQPCPPALGVCATLPTPCDEGKKPPKQCDPPMAGECKL